MRRLIPLIICAHSAACVPADDDVESADVSNEVNSCPEAEEYFDGIERSGEQNLFRFTIAASTPAPPEVGDNYLTVSVASIAGTEFVVESMELEPTMPLHNHGTSPAIHVGRETGTKSAFDFGDFYLFMPGTWEYRIRVVTSVGTDEVAFQFCVLG